MVLKSALGGLMPISTSSRCAALALLPTVSSPLRTEVVTTVGAAGADGVGGPGTDGDLSAPNENGGYGGAGGAGGTIAVLFPTLSNLAQAAATATGGVGGIAGLGVDFAAVSGNGGDATSTSAALGGRNAIISLTAIAGAGGVAPYVNEYVYGAIGGNGGNALAREFGLASSARQMTMNAMHAGRGNPDRGGGQASELWRRRRQSARSERPLHQEARQDLCRLQGAYGGGRGQRPCARNNCHLQFVATAMNMKQALILMHKG